MATTVVTTEATTGPTTQPTTPVTTMPTTIPQRSSRQVHGSVYLSHASTGVNIYNTVHQPLRRPAIIILPVRTGHASRLNGYKDVQFYFEVEQDMTTIIAPRTLIPGIGTMPNTTNPPLTITTVPHDHNNNHPHLPGGNSEPVTRVVFSDGWNMRN